MKAENIDLPLPSGVEKPLSTLEPANVAQFEKVPFLEKVIVDFKALPMLAKIQFKFLILLSSSFFKFESKFSHFFFFFLKLSPKQKRARFRWLSKNRV